MAFKLGSDIQSGITHTSRFSTLGANNIYHQTLLVDGDIASTSGKRKHITTMKLEGNYIVMTLRKKILHCTAISFNVNF